MVDILKKKGKLFWIILTGFLVFLILSYTFIPFTPITFSPQEQFRSDSDINLALISMAELWGIPKESLYVFATHINTNRSKSVAILEPNTLSSASVWIPSLEIEHTDSIRSIGPPGSNLYLLSQYTPQGKLEKAIAHNFYIHSWAKTNKAIIVYIKTGILFGEIRLDSLVKGDLRVVTFLGWPIFFLTLHVDY